MRVLVAVGVGLVLVVLDLAMAGVDVVADPVGWLLVVGGCQALPPTLPGRRATLVVAVLAGVVSVPLAVPAVRRAVVDLDESLLWAIDLPPVLFVAALALTLGRGAGVAGDVAARGWWRLVLAGAVVMVVLPPLVYGAGALQVVTLGVLISLATVLGATALCFAHAGRSWARGS